RPPRHPLAGGGGCVRGVSGIALNPRHVFMYVGPVPGSGEVHGEPALAGEHEGPNGRLSSIRGKSRQTRRAGRGAASGRSAACAACLFSESVAGGRCRRRVTKLVTPPEDVTKNISSNRLHLSINVPAGRKS